jgi:hypothetical protein
MDRGYSDVAQSAGAGPFPSVAVAVAAGSALGPAVPASATAGLLRQVTNPAALAQHQALQDQAMLIWFGIGRERRKGKKEWMLKGP